MQDVIRLATPEEIEKIKETSDLIPGSTVITFGGKDFAVVRHATEIDPVHYHEASSHSRKLFFLTNLETSLRLNGVPQYYFNIHAADEKTIATMEKLGAIRLSTEPEHRFKKLL